MKKHLILSTTLAILGSISNAAIAASIIDAYQRGDTNNLTVIQSGIIDSTVAIDQNGNDIASITQVGSNTMTPNSVSVVQDGTLFMNSNSIQIDQKAGGNTASIYQTSLIPTSALVNPYTLTPFVTVGLGNNTGGVAYGNTATGLQNGTGNQLGIVQMGNDNTATLTQDTNNLSVIAQLGNENQAIVNQVIGTGVSASINDIGAVIVQLGNNGSASIVQNNLATFNSATIWQTTSSSNSTANVTQAGAYNSAKIKQFNTFNTASVTQSGWGSSNGGKNEVIITQKGSGVSGLMDTATVTQSIGDSNSVNITQYRGDGSMVSVLQEGSELRAIVRQH